jgi:hypothetical protein
MLWYNELLSFSIANISKQIKSFSLSVDLTWLTKVPKNGSEQNYVPESNKLAQVGFTLAKFNTKLPARAVTDNFNLLAMDILDDATQIEIILPVSHWQK